MTNQDFEKFERAINELACCYCAKIDGEELAAYFRNLSRFPIEIVERQLAEATKIYPKFFPKAGELYNLCEQEMISNQSHIESIDSVAAIRWMSGCEHDFKFEPEPEPDGLFAGFEVCQNGCGFSKPVVRSSASEKQKQYFEMAIAGAPE